MRFWLLLFHWENRNDLQAWPEAAILSKPITAEKTYQALKTFVKKTRIHIEIVHLIKIWKQTKNDKLCNK